MTPKFHPSDPAVEARLELNVGYKKLRAHMAKLLRAFTATYEETRGPMLAELLEGEAQRLRHELIARKKVRNP